MKYTMIVQIAVFIKLFSNSLVMCKLEQAYHIKKRHSTPWTFLDLCILEAQVSDRNLRLGTFAIAETKSRLC